jgi:hypothetical protein
LQHPLDHRLGSLRGFGVRKASSQRLGKSGSYYGSSRVKHLPGLSDDSKGLVPRELLGIGPLGALTICDHRPADAGAQPSSAEELLRNRPADLSRYQSRGGLTGAGASALRGQERPKQLLGLPFDRL